MEITNVQILPSSVNPCLNFDLRIQTDSGASVVVVTVAVGTIYEFSISNPGPPRDFTITIPRQGLISNIRVSEFGLGVTGFATFTQLFVPTWQLLQPSITPTVQGVATVNANIQLNNNGVTSPAMGFEISLDGVNYQTSNTFVGLTVGESYTLYVKDGFGCEKTLDFTVNEILPTLEPYFFISKLNPIYFALKNGLRNNPNNQLSYEFATDTNFKDFHYQLWNQLNYQFQFRSNYSNNKVILVDCFGEQTELTITKKSNNIAVVDIRNCTIIAPTSEIPFVQLFFEGGNIYSPTDPSEVIGVSTLNGTLLQYHTIGSFVELLDEGSQNGVFQIIDIIDTDNGRRILLDWDIEFLGAQPNKVKTLYNQSNYEVYEFAIPQGLVEGKYQLAIFADNDQGTTLRALSEQFVMTNELAEKHHVFSWKNNANNQITWETGIECTTCLPYNELPTFSPESEDEVFMTDIAPRLLESNNNEVFTFHLGLLPTNIARQIAFIVSNDFLKIDDELYTKQETPEIEPQNGSNNCIVNVPLLLSTTFNSNERRGVSDINTNVGGYLQINESGFLEID